VGSYVGRPFRGAGAVDFKSCWAEGKSGNTTERTDYVPDIRGWSFGTVALASALWIVLVIALTAAYVAIFLFDLFRSQSQQTGAAGIGAVSVGIGEGLALVVLFILFGPPIVLAITWFFIRRS
jgi:hypothetical protein